MVLASLLTICGTGVAAPPAPHPPRPAPVPAPAPAPVPESEASIRTRIGREASKAGKAELARHHFLDAVALDPSFAPAWTELATLDAADLDAKALWALGASFALTDAAGRPVRY